MTEPKANDRQVGGNHYKNQAGYEHWDFGIALQLDGITWTGTKYVSRWRKKGGVQDLEKALHYIDKRLEVGDQIDRTLFYKLDQMWKMERFWDFTESNHIEREETQIIYYMVFWTDKKHLKRAREMIEELIARHKEKSIDSSKLPLEEIRRAVQEGRLHPDNLYKPDKMQTHDGAAPDLT